MKKKLMIGFAIILWSAFIFSVGTYVGKNKITVETIFNHNGNYKVENGNNFFNVNFETDELEYYDYATEEKYISKMIIAPDETSISATLPSLGKVVLVKENDSEDVIAIYEVNNEMIVGKYVYTGKPLVNIANFTERKA